MATYGRPAKPIGRTVLVLLGKLVEHDGCLLFTGAIDAHGYGNMTVDRRPMKPHRYVYELINGPIPEGLQIDHTCHNEDLSCPGGDSCLHRRCCHPDHLEAVRGEVNRERGRSSPPRENAGKTHCKYGHEFTPENTYINPTSKGRVCRICMAANRDKWGAENPEKMKAGERASRKRWEAKNREHRRQYQKARTARIKAEREAASD